MEKVYSDFYESYKEHLKRDMFHSIWNNMHHYWNKPNNDCLPHTQFVRYDQILFNILEIALSLDMKI